MTGLAAANGRLYVATTTSEGKNALWRRAPVAVEVTWEWAHEPSAGNPPLGLLAATRSRLLAFGKANASAPDSLIRVLEFDKGWRGGWEKREEFRGNKSFTRIVAVAHLGGTLYAVAEDASGTRKQALLRAPAD